jgi:hypothetical protein
MLQSRRSNSGPGSTRPTRNIIFTFPVSGMASFRIVLLDGSVFFKQFFDGRRAVCRSRFVFEKRLWRVAPK